MIIFENDNFIIVNKPSGLLVHADHTQEADLLSLLQNDKKSTAPTASINRDQSASKNKTDSYLSPLHLLNRLDKETSGLVLIVKKTELVPDFQALLEHSTKKYIAVLRGHLPVHDDLQIWDWPISDKAEGGENPQGKTADRKPAVTKFKVLQSNSYFSLVELQIETGRQHQIRKHARLAGRPVVGDNRYGNAKDNTKIKDRYRFARMALHAYQLILTPDFTWGEVNEFTCPIPSEFESLF